MLGIFLTIDVEKKGDSLGYIQKNCIFFFLPFFVHSFVKSNTNDKSLYTSPGFSSHL